MISKKKQKGLHSKNVTKSGVSPQKTLIWTSICAPEAPSLLISSAHSPRLGGHNFRLGGHKQSVGGARPRYAPPWRRVWQQLRCANARGFYVVLLGLNLNTTGPAAELHEWGGGGGAEKIFWVGRKNIWGEQINFTFFGKQDLPKKRSSSWPFIFFRGTCLARGDTFIAWRGAAEHNGADLASCPQIQG